MEAVATNFPSITKGPKYRYSGTSLSFFCKRGWPFRSKVAI